MSKFTVIWRDDGDKFITTMVEILAGRNPQDISRAEWVDLAYAVECGWGGECESDYLPSLDGYELIAVIAGEVDFIY